MKSLRIITLLTFVMLAFAISASAQLMGTKNIPGDYADLAAAITDLNTQGVGAGGVTFNLVAGNPQTAPAEREHWAADISAAIRFTCSDNGECGKSDCFHR